MEYEIISLIVTVTIGVASMVLAIFAIWLGKSSERESRMNFERTQEQMRLYNDRSKEVLAEIDKKAAVIEKTVSDSQQQLLDTVTNLLNETLTPQKTDFGEQMTAMFLQEMLKTHDNAEDFVKSLQTLSNMGNAQQLQVVEQNAKSQRGKGRS